MSENLIINCENQSVTRIVNGLFTKKHTKIIGTRGPKSIDTKQLIEIASNE